MSAAPGSNLPEFTVSELSGHLKRTVEGAFPHVRVRAEVGRVTFHGNGHVYLDLKDDKAVLNGVVWRSSVAKLTMRPEQGLEVIATGRLTTFPGRSQYQMVIEQIEAAGVGALMALLEERRKKLAAEGLFAEDRKQPLPFLPEVIGVITSPTGAVIRDIMHRLADRFPRHVLLWPVVVQGDAAAAQVSAAIEGFNALPKDGPVPRPDVLIVARGGGSIEDLWGFNEEAVVRAAAASTIPLISAVGHETDTTLIDYASDRRAPTPTAAAEMAVPVRTDLVARTLDLERRLLQAQARRLEDRRQRLTATARSLPRLKDIAGQARQRLDYAETRLAAARAQGVAGWRAKLDLAGARLRPTVLARTRQAYADQLTRVAARLVPAMDRRISTRNDRLGALAKLLKTLSYQGTLERGFALVQRADGTLVRSTGAVAPGDAVTLTLADGRVAAHIADADEAGAAPETAAAKPRAKPAKASAARETKSETPGGDQGQLF